MKKNPECLFHYTSTDTAQLILANREIWKTDVRFSNDRTEGQYSASVFKETFTNLLHRERDETLRVLMKRIGGLYQLGFYTKDCLAFCLSEHGDLLSQWDRYANNATGVCIGFDYETLNFEMITGSFLTNKIWGSPVPFVRPVTYGPDLVQKIAASEYRHARKRASNFKDKGYMEMPQWDEHLEFLRSHYTPRKIKGRGKWKKWISLSVSS